MGDLKNDFLMHFLTLKKLNRLDKLRTKHTREATMEAKSKVDSFHLQLQNLRYEVLHLEKEVTKCLQYKSLDESIDLVPLEQFYKEAPEDVSKKDKTKSNEHLQRLARLQYEKLQREKQSEEFKKLEEEKDALESHINKKCEKLANLTPQLSAILTAAKPVQEFLEMPLNEDRDQLQLAKYLPGPLFVLFSETRAFSQACDPYIGVKITGDLEEAKAEFASNLRKRMATTGDNVNDEDEDKDEEDEEDSKKKKKKSGGKADVNEKVSKILATHPLKVELQIKNKGSDNVVILTFSHLTELEVVSVKVKLVLDQECKGFGGDREVLQAHNLLSHLLTAGDEGQECPNPAFNYILKKAGIDSNMINFNGTCMFSWAQNLCGLQFPAKADPEIEENYVLNASSSISQPLVEKTIDAIRQRLVSRIFLQREISLLEKSKLITIDMAVPEKMKSQFPSKISSTIRAWASVNWDQYVSLDVTKHLVESGAVDEHDFLFRLQINRDSAASLIALIAVKPDHPFTPPVFCLNLHWNGEHNLHNSEYIRYLERTVNYGFVHLLQEDGPEKYEMLSLQIKKLMSCCDVLLESWQMQGEDQKQDFTREKMFLHVVRYVKFSLIFKPKLT